MWEGVDERFDTSTGVLALVTHFSSISQSAYLITTLYSIRGPVRSIRGVLMLCGAMQLGEAHRIPQI